MISAFEKKHNRRVTFREITLAKWYAVSTFAEFILSFSNWREAWSAYCACLPLPPLVLRNGLKLEHGSGDDPLLLFREIFREQQYTRRQFYTPQTGHVVLDIGANLGFFALFLQRRAPGIRVHCFEPASAVFNFLCTNLCINACTSNIIAHKYALSDIDSVGNLLYHPNNVQRGLMRDRRAGGGGELVETITLERALDICGESHVDMMKVDIEGGEVELVCGSKPETWKQIDRAAIEFHDDLRPGCRALLEKALRERGFERLSISATYPSKGQGILHATR